MSTAKAAFTKSRNNGCGLFGTEILILDGTEKLQTKDDFYLRFLQVHYLGNTSNYKTSISEFLV